MRERNRQLTLEMARTSDEIVAQIMPLLAGRNPMTQGAVIAELLAIWLAGNHPSMRCQMLKIAINTAIDMVPLHDRWPEQK